MGIRRTFTKEFKLNIIHESEHRSLTEVCREHDLHPSLISRWKREQVQYPKSAFMGQGNLYKLEAQLAERDRLIGQLYAENALLKKAMVSAQKRSAEERMLRSIK